MAITKIKAMAKTLEKMETMRASVEEDINKDIDEKRKKAFKAISDYMDEIANALDGTSVEFELTTPAAYRIYSDKGRSNYYIRIGFNARYWTSSSNSYSKSEEPISWWICRIEEDGCWHGNKSESSGFRYHFMDGGMDIYKKYPNDKKVTYEDGVINFIEAWSTLKPQIEEAVEKELKEKMNNACKTAEDRMTSYKIVDGFEV